MHQSSISYGLAENEKAGLVLVGRRVEFEVRPDKEAARVFGVLMTVVSLGSHVFHLPRQPA